MQVVCAAHESTPDVVPFPADLVQVEGEPGSRRTWVEGLEDILLNCYERDALPERARHPLERCRPRGRDPAVEQRTPPRRRRALTLAAS